jgi:porphobilinogen synthase
LLVMTETCLCLHTFTGDCHPRDSHGHPDQRAAIEQIAAQAVVQADAGADVVGPASMIPGSVRAVRQALDETGHDQVQIMPHLMQIMPHLIWRSCLYQEFRQTMEAMPSSGQRPFHLCPGDPVAGMRAALAMLGEGADSLLLEPALTCADLLIQLHSVHPEVPLVPFSVSGEYRRLTRSAELGPLVELLTMLKRAGAERIITYAAVEIAATLL